MRIVTAMSRGDLAAMHVLFLELAFGISDVSFVENEARYLCTLSDVRFAG